MRLFIAPLPHGLIASLLVGAIGCRPAPAIDRARPDEAPPSGPYVWHLPAGIPAPRIPKDNPLSAAKVELGRRLFYDTRLSGNQSYSCGSCHQQARAFTDGRAHALGSTGASHPRSAMSLANVAYNTSYGWADPSVRSLEAQIAVPMFNEHPVELGLAGRQTEVVARFAAQPGARAWFAAAFPDDPDPVAFSNIVKAIAAFERTIVSGDSPLDRYLYRDDHSALSPAAVRGMALFFSKRLQCSDCHGGFNLSGTVVFEGSSQAEPMFHNTGLYDVDGAGSYPPTDRGLIDKTGRPADMGRFRVPTLRNIAVTAPYMHDGSVPTLEAAIAHYASGGKASRFRSRQMTGFRLSAEETSDLIQFLESLTDQRFLTNPAFSPPRSATRSN
jgi:cytochrome c peroxidase